VFCSDVPATHLQASDCVVGIDVGITELVATSDGVLIGNPLHLRSSLGQLAAKQRLIASRRLGSNRRRKAAQQLGRLHRRIANQRRDLAHQISRQLVNEYGTIVHEDLHIANMVRRPAPQPNEEGGFSPNGAAAKGGLNREFLAAGWGQFLRFIAYKAEEAGREVIAVNPRHTSQTCHHCGNVDPGNRHATEFRCTGCGHVDHADVNAARNILRAGLARRHEREVDRNVAPRATHSAAGP
jgi:putative transposase